MNNEFSAGDEVAARAAKKAEDDALEQVKQRRVTRRRLLGTTGAAATGAVGASQMRANAAGLLPTVGKAVAGIVNALVGEVELILGAEGARFGNRTDVFWIRRRQDMLRLRVTLYNLEPGIGNNAQKLVKNNPLRPAHIVVEFPPQHIAEEALHDASPPATFDPSEPDAKARIAGTSTLTFEVPDKLLPLARSVSGLLRWPEFVPYLIETAVPTGTQTGPTLRAPATGSDRVPAQTALELPYQLVLSPLPKGESAWMHRSTVPTGPGSTTPLTELWHTRLGQFEFRGINEPPTPGESDPRHVRAVWSFEPGVNDPFQTSALTRADRAQIVQNSSMYTDTPEYKASRLHVAASNKMVPEPITVNRLMLSALGGWLDVDGSWTNPTSVTLEGWRHRAAMGRDTYVKVVKRGYFFPFGFYGVLIQVTERVTSPQIGHGDQHVAYLRKREFLVIRTPVVNYPVEGQANDALDLPFKSVRAKTVTTPSVVLKTLLSTKLKRVFTLDGATPYLFDLEFTDWDGNVSSARFPMSFVEQGDEADPFVTEFNCHFYEQLPEDDPFRQLNLNGARLAYAESGQRGDTTYETSRVVMGAAPCRNAPVGGLIFGPRMNAAHVRIEAAEAVTGAPLPEPVRVKFVDDATPNMPAGTANFLKNRFNDNANPQGVFLFMPDDDDHHPPTLTFANGDVSGGLALPTQTLTALSRAQGAIGGDIAHQLANKFNPSNVFGALDSTLLGGLKLIDVIDDRRSYSDSGIEISTVDLHNPDGRQARLHWAPTLKGNGVLVPGDDASFVLDVTSRQVDGQGLTLESRGELRNVTLQLVGGSDLHFIDIELRHLIFTARTGSSPHVDVGLGQVEFTGPLEFVNGLRDLLSSQDGPISIDVSETGIVARSHIAVPNLPIGIFQLTGLAFNTTITVPFMNKPMSAEFGISSKDDPFLLAVSLFGGGGWFSLGIDSSGIQSIDAGLEFGASAAVDFGVAAGSIEIMAGFYFTLTPGADNNSNIIHLGGYFRMHGEVRVGFVAVGLSVQLTMDYCRKKGQSVVTGGGEITLELPLAPPLSFHFEKTFGDAPNDPRFVEQVNASEWSAYTSAFALEGA